MKKPLDGKVSLRITDETRVQNITPFCFIPRPCSSSTSMYKPYGIYFEDIASKLQIGRDALVEKLWQPPVPTRSQWMCVGLRPRARWEGVNGIHSPRAYGDVRREIPRRNRNVTSLVTMVPGLF